MLDQLGQRGVVASLLACFAEAAALKDLGDDAFFVDHDGATHGAAEILVEAVVGLRDCAMGPTVGEYGKVDAGLFGPGFEGELGVLPLHAPLVTALAPGELNYTKDGTVTELAVGEGFVEVTQERVAVLTDMALADSEIDESAAEEAVKRAEEALANKDSTPDDAAIVRATLQKSLAQLKIKRKNRRA